MSTTTHRYAGWELRPADRSLLVRGQPAKVGSRAYAVLLALIERQGRVATRDELLAAAWPGLVVEENNLSVQITALRKLLGARAIINESGVGYMLSQTALDTDPQPVALDAAAERQPSSPPALVGRDADMVAVGRMLQSAALVSIVGTGGVGKTSLARALIARAAQRWRDGVHWIDLSPLGDAGDLMPMVARSLGIVLKGSSRDAADFNVALSRCEVLIVLDNCEHLVPQVTALVEPALRQAPGACWLTTSQVPLHLTGECVYRLAPLVVPTPGDGLAQSLTCGALALLCERAAAADNRFVLTSESLQTAVALCQQLDGLPLAIEMAAARVATLGLQEVHEQLAQRLRLRSDQRNAPHRHNTLLQTFEWSHGLLSAEEQRVFRRLQPFVDGFTPALAQQLCCAVAGEALDPWHVGEHLASLVDKSILQRSASGRLHLLENARAYARLRLQQAQELPLLQLQHALVLADWFDLAHANFEHESDAAWRARCLPERHNIRTALHLACEAGDPALLARLVVAMAQFDLVAHARSELMQCNVPLPVLAAAPVALRAAAYLELGWAHYLAGSRETGTDLVELALSDYEAVGSPFGTYRALSQLVRLCESRPHTQQRARAHWQRLQQFDHAAVPLRTRLICAISAGYQYGGRNLQGLQNLHALAQKCGFDGLAAVCRTHITDELLVQGRFEETVATAQAMLARPGSLPRERALVCHNQALALIRLGRAEEALAPAQEALRVLPYAAHMVADLFALSAVQDRRWTDAALLAGYGARVKRERDLRSDPAEAQVVADTLRSLTDALGGERLDLLLQLGAAMSSVEVLALALGPAVPKGSESFDSPLDATFAKVALPAEMPDPGF